MKVFRVSTLLLATLSARAMDRQTLHSHLPAAVTHLQPVDRLASTNRLRLAIGFPLRNRKTLADFLHQLYDPANPHFHHYLTPDQFAESFGPTAHDYAAAIAFAEA